ncbi:MAG: hypothetical protein HZB19_00495 [Chloroflexi bacterium]|nr:hypothetical protein [Chloroflexota bacterium]
MSHKLLILSKHFDEYSRLIESSNLPDLDEIVSRPTEDCDIVFGEPNLIRDALPLLSHPKWIQSNWAGVEPLLDPATPPRRACLKILSDCLQRIIIFTGKANR